MCAGMNILNFSVARLMVAVLGIAVSIWIGSVLHRVHGFPPVAIGASVVVFTPILVVQALSGDWSSFGCLCFVVAPMIVASHFSLSAAVVTLLLCLFVGTAIERQRGSRNLFSRD